MQPSYNTDDFKNALTTLKNGGIILYPTDTVWGIGCDATNPEAVKKVIEIKKRNPNKGFIILLDNEFKINQYLKEVPEMAWSLLELSEKPLTLICPGGKNVAPHVTTENEDLVIRVTKEVFSNNLCRQFRRPIVSTSANISGNKTPCCFDEIDEEIKARVDYIVEFKQEEHSFYQPSSIIKLGLYNEIQIIRK